MHLMARGRKGTRHFPVVVELDEDGVYIVTCPQFKGCHSYGKTVDEAFANIREAWSARWPRANVVLPQRGDGTLGASPTKPHQ